MSLRKKTSRTVSVGGNAECNTITRQLALRPTLIEMPRVIALDTLAQEGLPPDHLGIELKFMALLAHDEHEAWQAGERARAHALSTAQADFVTRHLLAWVPGYVRAIEAQDAPQLYKTAAAITLGAIRGVDIY